MQKVEAHILTKEQEERGWSCHLESGRLRIYLKDEFQLWLPSNTSIEQIRQAVAEREKALAGIVSIIEGSD